MSDFTLVNHDAEQTYVEATRADAEDRMERGISEFGFSEEDLDIITGAFESYDDVEIHATTDGGEAAVVESEDQDDPEDVPEPGTYTPGDEGTPAAKAAQPTPAESEGESTTSGINALAQNPIDWLESKNTAYVNTIKGTPSISKRGFRYIQSRFEITTESKIVKWVDDPLGVVVWARAELPDGRSAEAHGEGYQFEGDLDDNEFVRYSDTRAKNRALADLTSSGALATEEMEGGK